MLPPSSTGLQVSMACQTPPPWHLYSAWCSPRSANPAAQSRHQRLAQGIIGMRALSSLNMLRHAGCPLVLVTGETISHFTCSKH